MKNNLKKIVKDKFFIGGVSCVLVIAIIITVILCLPDKTTETPPWDTTSETTSSEIDVPDISQTDPGTSIETDDAESENTGDAVVDLETGAKSGNTGGNAEKPVTPVTEAPEKNDGSNNNNNSSGIVIGEGDKPTTYNCGSANHHCKNADAHAYILNLELEGCQYCGSHSCPSFYGTDEWGNTGLFPKLCPKYSEKGDPVYYCQECGKKNGNGDKDTCQKWIVDFTCPICGQLVKANTCHTH